MTPLSKPITRVTRDPFFHYGPDRDKKFVATLAPGDLLTLRPIRSRPSKRTGTNSAEVSIALVDVYRYGLLCRTRTANQEKAKAAKAKKDTVRKTRALDRQIRRESL